MITLECSQCGAEQTARGGRAAAGLILVHETQNPGHHMEAH